MKTSILLLTILISASSHAQKLSCQLLTLGDKKSTDEINYNPNTPLPGITIIDLKEVEIISDNIIILNGVDTSFYYSKKDTLYLMKSWKDIAVNYNNENYYDKNWITISKDKLFYYSNHTNIKYGFSVEENIDYSKRIEQAFKVGQINFPLIFFDFKWDNLLIISSQSDQDILTNTTNFKNVIKVNYSKEILFYFIYQDEVVGYGTINDSKLDLSPLHKKKSFYKFEKDWTYFLGRYNKEKNKLTVSHNG